MRPIERNRIEDDEDDDVTLPRNIPRALDPDDDANRAEGRLAEALRELHERGDQAVGEIRRIGARSPRIVIGVSIGIAVMGALALWMRSRRRGRSRRPRGITHRIAAELAKEVAGRALTTAASVMAAHVTEEILLPMARERLAAERNARPVRASR